MPKSSPRSVDEYIERFPEDVQEVLKKIRRTIQKAAPEAQESIQYQMPTYSLKGNLVSFGAYKKHIGLYPAPEGDEQFNRQLAAYKAEKSTIRFPLDRPIPYDLILQIVKYRIEDNQRREEAKTRKR